MVWFVNYGPDAKDVGGWPLTFPFATFDQLTTSTEIMSYTQGDIAALTFLDAGDTYFLLVDYKLVLGDNLPPISATTVSFLFSGWVERNVAR